MLQLIIYLNQKSLIGSTLKKREGMSSVWAICYNLHASFCSSKRGFKSMDDFFPANIAIKKKNQNSLLQKKHHNNFSKNEFPV